MILLNKKLDRRGFTLIEVMVSVAIFSIVVTAGMGALMSILGSYHYSQREKKAADSVSYVLENMTREIRLGFNYYVQPPLDGSSSEEVLSGAQEVNTTGTLIGFDASDHRGYIIYHLRDGILFKKQFTGGHVYDVSLTDPSQVLINKARVTVMNTDKFDEKQPLVWLQLKVETPNANSSRIVQILVSQRSLDVPPTS